MRTVLGCLLIFAITLVTVRPMLACGPEYLDPVFGFTRHAEYPLADYSGGKLGLIPNTYGRISLFVYYRYLNNLPFNDLEKKEVARAIERRIGIAEASDGPDTENEKPLTKWLTLRQKIIPGKKELDQYKQIADSYYYYPNCLDDSFKKAVSTLEARISESGHNSFVIDWVRGQDAVFSNCRSDGTIPSEAPQESPDWLRKDRDYQIAAAHFYRGELGDARKAFRLISEDTGSPWNKTSRYLVARTFIREASFLDSDRNDSAEQKLAVLTQKKQLLNKAAAELRAIESDPEMEIFHDPARKLLGLVKYRADPVARTVELAETLSRTKANTNIYNELTDYIFLLDELEERAEKKADEARSSESAEGQNEYDDSGYRIRLRDVDPKERNQDLTDWLVTYQSTDGYSHAFDKWKQSKEVHWLAAAISLAVPTDENVDQLIKTANELDTSSPAFYTSMYYAIQLSVDSGNSSFARQMSDKVLTKGFNGVPVATRNSFYAQRTGFAQSLTEFLKYSKRIPTDYVWSFDFNEAGLQGEYYAGVTKWKNREMFGEDAVRILNSKMPLSIWLQAANDEQIPPHLKDFIVSAGWARAFLLKDKAAERAFEPLVARYSKDFAPLFATYDRARTTADKEAAALIVIARYPVLEPFIQSGWGRKDFDAKSIESIRGNWWCLEKYRDGNPTPPLFLSAAELSAGKAEYEELLALGEGATSIASRSVEFARQNPRHLRTPEILHLAVRSSRYGCTDGSTGTHSRAAFQLLHTRYKNSYWTKRTPYWYQ